MTFSAELAASVSLLALAGVSSVDGVAFHLVRDRLPFRPGSRFEHGLHTLRAALFPLALVGFFEAKASLMTGLLILAADQAVGVWDMAVERQSRAFSGGLRSSEYVTHGVLITLHAAAIAFTLAARLTPATATSPLRLATVTGWLLPGAILAALVHIVLLAAPAWASPPPSSSMTGAP